MLCYLFLYPLLQTAAAEHAQGEARISLEQAQRDAEDARRSAQADRSELAVLQDKHNEMHSILQQMEQKNEALQEKLAEMQHEKDLNASLNSRISDLQEQTEEHRDSVGAKPLLEKDIFFDFS